MRDCLQIMGPELTQEPKRREEGLVKEANHKTQPLGGWTGLYLRSVGWGLGHTFVDWRALGALPLKGQPVEGQEALMFKDSNLKNKTKQNC